MDILYDRIIEGNKHFIKAAGLSTEVPPTQINGANLASGSQYAQVDTGTIQMFDGRGRHNDGGILQEGIKKGGRYMVAWYFVPIAFVVGMIVGVFLLALVSANED